MREKKITSKYRENIFQTKQKKTKKPSDPQRAPLTAPHTYRWPCRYQPILAISSYKQISESHKITVRVYGLVKAEQTITSGRIFSFFFHTWRPRKTLFCLFRWPWTATGKHRHAHGCVCVSVYVCVCLCRTGSISPHP